MGETNVNLALDYRKNDFRSIDILRFVILQCECLRLYSVE
jgi:hypothetical protein